MIAGWDIGGVNTKLAMVDGGEVRSVAQRAFELQREPDALVPLLRSLLDGAAAGPDVAHAVTMTAELSQMFRTKREGVAFVLDAVERAFPDAPIRIYAVDGRFLETAAARQEPLAVAAANWSATARAVGRQYPNAILVDVGTTTSDVIPIVDGRVAAAGVDDPSRLASGELVYSGALRTPVEAIASHVTLNGHRVGVSAEGFALIGDVHLWRGDLAAEDYAVATPDGRPVTKAFAGERLARVVCADREMLDAVAVSAMADAIADAQVTRLAAAIRRVRERCPMPGVAVVTGLGAFIAERAALACGLRPVRLDQQPGVSAQCAPAAAVALLLEDSHKGQSTGVDSTRGPAVWRIGFSPVAEVVVKVGGGLLAHPSAFCAVLDTIAAARDQRVLVVPGGGALADAVRELDRRYAPGDTASHWMAILAMDQVAHVMASALKSAALVDGPGALGSVFASEGIPVLAPYRWLRAEDPLPHSWHVTSDSIAAWVAGEVGATRLILIKPPQATEPGLTDDWFPRAVRPGTDVQIVPADDADALSSALRLRPAAAGIFAVADAGASP